MLLSDAVQPKPQVGQLVHICTPAAGGKLIHPHTRTPQNTRISAVIALENFAIGQREFRIKLAKKQQEEDRRLSAEEFHEFYQSHYVGAELARLEAAEQRLLEKRWGSM